MNLTKFGLKKARKIAIGFKTGAASFNKK